MLAGIVLTLISLWAGQNHGLLPVAASDDAVLIDGLFNSMMTVSVGIFLLVQGILIVCIFKFRRRPDDETDGPPIHGNLSLEIVWTAIPAVVVLVIGVYSFDVYKAMGGFDPDAASDPGVMQVAMLPGENLGGPLVDGGTMPMAKHPQHHHMALGIGAFPDKQGMPPDLSVNVMGLQYAWIFTYPESGVTSGELHIPINQDVRLTIKAQDVLHAFWLPQFRLKQDAIPGRDTEIRFTPRLAGTYPIICAELCGAYHGAMNTKLIVETPEEFTAWIQEQVASGNTASQTVAANPTRRSDAEFLAPVADAMDLQTKLDDGLLHQIRGLTSPAIHGREHGREHEMGIEQAAESIHPAA